MRGRCKKKCFWAYSEGVPTWFTDKARLLITTSWEQIRNDIELC